MTENKYRIEFVPRYGSTIGIIWKNVEQEREEFREYYEMEKGEGMTDNQRKEETIGHIRISNEEEKEIWTTAIEKLNESLKVE